MFAPHGRGGVKKSENIADIFNEWSLRILSTDIFYKFWKKIRIQNLFWPIVSIASRQCGGQLQALALLWSLVGTNTEYRSKSHKYIVS